MVSGLTVLDPFVSAPPAAGPECGGAMWRRDEQRCQQSAWQPRGRQQFSFLQLIKTAVRAVHCTLNSPVIDTRKRVIKVMMSFKAGCQHIVMVQQPAGQTAPTYWLTVLITCAATV